MREGRGGERGGRVYRRIGIEGRGWGRKREEDVEEKKDREREGQGREEKR